ncbi:MAG: sulfotransferase family protein [bacterium]
MSIVPDTACRRPNLFLVGAPKCGTTAMYRYLADHRDIFMSPVKEPHFFGSDLINRYGIQDPDRYAKLFVAAGDARWVGEASVWYLLSERAALEIKEYSPSARIVIMLREPVEMLHSLHAQRVYSGNENITDFSAALDAEADRVRGDRIPRGCHVVQGLFYRRVVAYAEQVQRFFDVFGREQVHVVIYDDFKSDPARVYRDLMTFLELDSALREDFAVYNPSKRARSIIANRLIRKPPALVRLVAHRFLSEEQRRKLGRWLIAHTVVREKRPSLDPDLRDQLRREFTPRVQVLEALLNRDLRGWRLPPAVAA